MDRDIMNMVNMYVNIVNCIILLTLMIRTAAKLQDTRNRKNFIVMLLMVFWFNAADCGCWAFEGTDAPWKIPALHTVTFLYYLSMPFMYISFMRFMRNILKEKYVNNKYYILCMVPCFCAIPEAFASCFPGFLYSFSEANVYARSPLYFLHLINFFSFYAFCIMYLVSNRKTMDRRTFFTLLSFPTLPTICFIPQLLFYGIASVNVGLVISMIIMYVNLKNSIQFGVGNTFIFTPEYFQKTDKISFAEKIKRFIWYYGFNEHSIASIRDELQSNEMHSLEIVTGASGLLTCICFVLSFFSDTFRDQRIIYVSTTIICAVLTVFFHNTWKKGLAVILGYLFFVIMCVVNIYKCMVITPDEAPILFICVLFIAASVFCNKPFLIILIEYSAVFIYLDLARIYKPPDNALSDSIYLFILATLGTIIGYGTAKTKITSIYLTKNLDNEVAAKTKQLNAMSKEIVTTLTSSIESKDEYTNGHSERVANYAVMIAVKCGWSEAKCDELWMEAILHDVGKIGVPDSILKKTGKLTEEEFKIIQSHTTEGAKILENLASFPKAREAANFHHERINGKGYPEGLHGKDIPEAAKIVAIADAYDAMTTSRCYRPALAENIVLDELKNGRGTQFDAELLDVFLELLEEHGGSLLQETEAI